MSRPNRGVRARSSEVGATSDVNRPLRQTKLEPDGFNLKLSGSSDKVAFAARWITRVSVLAGGWVLLNRLATVPDGAASGETVVSDPSGRGQPAEPPSRAARKAGHETGDMNALTMARLAVGLLAVASIIIGSMVLVERLLRRVAVNHRPVLTAEQVVPIVPPAPNLQADAPADLTGLRARANALLDHYGWADPGHQRARIPIDRAMALMVGRPLDTAP